MNENKCPVCGSEEGLYISAKGEGYTCLHSHYIGSLVMRSCLECGCVYTKKWDREQYKRALEREKNGMQN